MHTATDSDQRPRRWRSRRQLALLLAGAGLIVLVLCVAYVFLIEPQLHGSAEESTPTAAAGGSTLRSTPFYWPGTRQPPTVAAREAAVPDDAEVIGVEEGGKARAYVVSAFAGPMHHVVNDVVAGVPVTVTHCDVSNCTRVLTGGGGEPLNVDLGGFYEGKLLLKVRGHYYNQEPGGGLNDDPLPYPDHAFTRTTWRAWKEAHPDTDVYCGEQPGPDRGTGEATR